MSYKPSARFFTLREAIEAAVAARAPDVRVYPETAADGTPIANGNARDIERQRVTLHMLRMIEAGEIPARWRGSRLPIRGEDFTGTFTRGDLDRFGVDDAGLRAFAGALSVEIVDTPKRAAPRLPRQGSDWKAQAQAIAWQIIERDRARRLYPSQMLVAEAVERECRERGIVGPAGTPLGATYIKRHALKGITSGAAERRTPRKQRGK